MIIKAYIQTAIEQEVTGVPDTGYNPFFFSADGSYLLFRFTDESFTRVLSALINGAYLTYGDEGLQTIWDFLVNVEFPVPFCAQLLECINSDGDVIAALKSLIRSTVTTDSVIRDYINSLTDNRVETILPREKQTENLLKTDQCGPGYTFNEASKTIDLLHSITSDLFEAIEPGTNFAERASLLLDAIPLLGELPIDEIISFIDGLLSDINEAYDAAYDEGLYDELRCELWCKIKDKCEMSIEDVYDFYNHRLTVGIPTNPLEAIVALEAFLTAGTLPGDAVVIAMHMLAIAAIRAGSTVMGIDFHRIALRIKSFGDDADNDYTICDDCPEIENCTSFVMDTDGLPFAGVDTGIFVRAGDTVTCTVTGTWNNSEADFGPNGQPPHIIAGYMSESIVIYRAMANISGMSDREWFEIGEEGSFVAPIDGHVMVAVNEYRHTVSTNDNTGSLNWEICVASNDCVDLTASQGGWQHGTYLYQPDDVYGHYFVGQGLGPSETGDHGFFWFYRQSGFADSVTLTFNEPVTGIFLGTSGRAHQYTGSPATEITFDETTAPEMFPLDVGATIYVTFATNNSPTTTLRVTMACIDMR